MKRTIALFLCLLMAVCPLLVACGDDSGTDTSSSASGTASGTASGSGGGEGGSLYQDENGNYTVANLEMPEFNFTETEFRVCVYNNVTQTTYFSEEIAPDLYDTTDSNLNEAVRTRNDLIEENYGVKIVAYQVEDVRATVSECVSTSTDLFDAAMPFMYGCVSLAQEGMLYDLNEYSDYIHLNAPWWDQSANDSLSIAGKLYFTTGDISIMQKIVSTAELFNKNLYNDYCFETYGDMYDLVRDYKWTLDTMYEMGKLVTSEYDGVPGMSINDLWGAAGTNGIIGYYISSGNSLITKDQSDYPMLSFGATEASLLYAEKILQIFQSDEWFINTQKASGVEGNVWEAAMGIFGEERALFYGCAFSAIKKLRNYDVTDNFGIIPKPLASEDQDRYYTCSSCQYAYGICIPVSVPNPEFSAYMIELMACGGKNTITPAYYDVTLKTRDAKDPDSEEMLDQYIFNNVVYDLGVLYDFGGISSMFNTLMANGSTAVASQLDSIKSSVESKIEEYVTAYEMDS